MICRNIDKLVPEMQDKVRRLKTFLIYHHIPMQIYETVRTKERQRMLFNKGRSKTLKSKHLTGRACDFVVYKNCRWSWANKHIFYFKVMGVFAEKLGLVWGGSWRWKDYAHVQLREVKK